MAWHAVPPLRSHPFRAVRPDCSPPIVVFDMEALHTLSETLGTTAVRPILCLIELITDMMLV